MSNVSVCIFIAFSAMAVANLSHFADQHGRVLAAIVWCAPASDNEQDGEGRYCEVEGLRIKEGETVPASIGHCHKITCHNATDSQYSSLTFVVIFAAIVWGAPASENEQDGELGYCNFKGLRIKEGETVPAPIGLCQEVTCQNATLPSLSSLTCAWFHLAPGSKCHKSEKDLTKPYPQCCPRKVCPEE